jgi:hypothetical protein
MLFTRKKIIIALLLLLLILFVLWWLFLRKPTVEVASDILEAEALQDLPTERVLEVTDAQPFVSEEEAQAISAKTTAKIFVERFGSYSNESNLQNVKDVLPLASRAYERTLLAMIDRLSGADATAYYGVSTRVISLSEKDLEDDRREITAMTQREEAEGSAQQVSVWYQEIVLEMVKEGEDWKVDGAEWKEV